MVDTVRDRLVSATEVADLCGVPYRTLDSWVRRGWVTPEVAAEGPGKYRRFGFRGTLEACTVAKLRSAGMTPKAIGNLRTGSWWEKLMERPHPLVITSPSGEQVGEVDVVGIADRVSEFLEQP
jgi:hypothetical protein